ncbi:hypothetical protein GCM10009672_04780 [Nesterenkonia lutea]
MSAGACTGGAPSAAEAEVPMSCIPIECHTPGTNNGGARTLSCRWVPDAAVCSRLFLRNGQQ